MLRQLALAYACACAITGISSISVAGEVQPLLAIVSIADQKAQIYIDSKLTYTWEVSTSSPDNKDCTVGGVPDAPAINCVTPTGAFRVVRVNILAHAAAKWHKAPMPHAVFFDGQGDAFHGTDGTANELAKLGQQDSHGCVRLAPENAAIWYELVEQHRNGRWWPGVVIKIKNAHLEPAPADHSGYI